MEFRDLFLLYSALILLLYLFWFLYRMVELYVWKYPPGPIGIPLIGTFTLWDLNLHLAIQNLNKKYGKVCSVNLALFRAVFVSDYDTAKELLCHRAALDRVHVDLEFIPGKAGFGALNGEEWSTGRKISVHAMRNISPGKLVEKIVSENGIGRILEYLLSLKGKPSNIRDELAFCTMDNFISCFIGQKFRNEMGNDFVKLCSATNVALRAEFDNIFVSSFPWLRKLFVKFRVGRYAENSEMLDTFTHFTLRELRNRLSSNDSDETMEYIEEYKKQWQKQNISEKWDEESCIECLLGSLMVFVSSSETTMGSVHWLLLLLAQYPEIQAKIHEEIDSVVGKDSPVTWENRYQFPYSCACVREVERWAARVPFSVPRCASETFEFKGYKIPRDTVIVPNLWALNRDPKYWDCPDEFRPERFLDISADKQGKRQNNGYAPFSFGKRTCPAEMIVTPTVFLYFTAIIQKFKVRTPSGEPPDLRMKCKLKLEPQDQYLCYDERK